MKFEEYKDNEIVKSLLGLGFSQEYIEKAVEAGEIKVEKSENHAAPGDHESETKQEEKINKEEKEAVKAEEKVKNDEKNTAKDEDAEGIKKSIENTIEKSFGSFASVLEGISKSLNALTEKVDKMGSQVPNFRSEGVETMKSIEKSMPAKDEAGKYEIDVVKQRSLACSMISKALDGASDEITKSLSGDALAFLTNPEADTVGENLARYMYEKGIKFVK